MAEEYTGSIVTDGAVAVALMLANGALPLKAPVGLVEV